MRENVRACRDDLLRRANVVAVGEGEKVRGGWSTGERCITVSVATKQPRAQLLDEDLVPAAIDGVQTDVVEIGVVRLRQTERVRPANPGVSVGHKDVTAGTLGAVVRQGPDTLILSNNHVLANLNEGQLGDPIYQPGVHDGGGPDDTIGYLDDYVEIIMVGDEPPVEPPAECGLVRGVVRAANAAAQLVGSRSRLRAVAPAVRAVAVNRVDCAVASVSPDDVNGDILGLGVYRPESAEAQIGMDVTKSGRTTGITAGMVTQLHVTVQVQLGAGRTAFFEDQVLVGGRGFSAPGDSGSLGLEVDTLRPFGLLFAGSDTATLFNPIDAVFLELALDEFVV